MSVRGVVGGGVGLWGAEGGGVGGGVGVGGGGRCQCSKAAKCLDDAA